MGRNEEKYTNKVFDSNYIAPLGAFVNKFEVVHCESRPLWKPMHMQALFGGCKTQLNGISEDMFSRGLCLPSGTEMNREDVSNISNIIKKCLDI